MKNVSWQHKFWKDWDFGDKFFEPKLEVLNDMLLPSIVDGPGVIKYYKGLEIAEGKTLTVSNRCKGMILFIDGDCIINGTLSMTARGANAIGDNIVIDYKKMELKLNPEDFDTNVEYEHKIGAVGGSGGGILNLTGSQHNGYSGSIGVNNACGGGGSGGGVALGWSKCYVYAGGNGTSYSGGSGSGSCACVRNDWGYAYGGKSTINGGKGGDGKYIKRSGDTYLAVIS